MSYVVRQLGKKGRFANQIFQYAHLRQRTINDKHECPYWLGEECFDLHDARPAKKSKDIGYWFPKHSSYYDKELFLRLFQPSEKWKKSLDSEWPVNRDYKLLGIHARRGDYGKFKRKSQRWCFVTPLQWYIDCINKNLFGMDKLHIYLASDEVNTVYDELSPLCQYPIFRTNLITSEAVLWDFFVLMRCDYMMISNSTFGFAASMLNQTAKGFWRPRLSAKALIPYDPWDSPVVFKDELYGL